MKSAIVENGEVVNIIVGSIPGSLPIIDNPPTVADSESLVNNGYSVFDDRVEVLYSVVDAIPGLIIEAKATAQKIRDELMYKGVEYLGSVFKSDAISAAEVHGQSMFYALDDANPSASLNSEWLLPHPAGHGGRWRTMDNSFLSMTLTEFHGLSKRLREYERNVSQQAHAVKGEDGGVPGLLDTCTTKAEIDQILTDFRGYVG